MGSTIGIPLYMDSSTGHKTRISNPRICVRIKADQELPEEVEYEDKDDVLLQFKVKYPWKPQTCTSCKSFGHSPSSCPMSKGKNAAKEQTTGAGIPALHERIYRAKAPATTQPVSTSNIFSVLQQSNVDDQPLAVAGSEAREAVLSPPRVSEEGDNPDFGSVSKTVKTRSKQLSDGKGNVSNSNTVPEIKGMLAPMGMTLLNTATPSISSAAPDSSPKVLMERNTSHVSKVPKGAPSSPEIELEISVQECGADDVHNLPNSEEEQGLTLSQDQLRSSPDCTEHIDHTVPGCVNSDMAVKTMVFGQSSACTSILSKEDGDDFLGDVDELDDGCSQLENLKVQISNIGGMAPYTVSKSKRTPRKSNRVVKSLLKN